ncbi:hypothetical protein CRG98_042964 [Punica granatum]|nr:hypothetical protein CRG98_042964 [Punica granatum]
MAANGSKFSFFPAVTVEIFNKLPLGATFTIHCKSKDDDLGTHEVGTGQSYSFHFKVNFWGTTLFFCRASHEGNNVDFEIYRASRDDTDRCPDYCMWVANGDGIMGYPESSSEKPDIVIPWKR